MTFGKLSRKELLQQWREDRRAVKENQINSRQEDENRATSRKSSNNTAGMRNKVSNSVPTPAPPPTTQNNKTIRVRVRRSNQTINTTNTNTKATPHKHGILRLYEQGTVASRMKLKQPSSKKYPSTLPKERKATQPLSLRRNSEPTNKPKQNYRSIDNTDDGFLNQNTNHIEDFKSNTRTLESPGSPAREFVIVQSPLESQNISPLSSQSSLFGLPRQPGSEGRGRIDRIEHKKIMYTEDAINGESSNADYQKRKSLSPIPKLNSPLQHFQKIDILQESRRSSIHNAESTSIGQLSTNAVQQDFLNGSSRSSSLHSGSRPLSCKVSDPPLINFEAPFERNEATLPLSPLQLSKDDESDELATNPSIYEQLSQDTFEGITGTTQTVESPGLQDVGPFSSKKNTSVTNNDSVAVDSDLSDWRDNFSPDPSTPRESSIVIHDEETATLMGRKEKEVSCKEANLSCCQDDDPKKEEDFDDETFDWRQNISPDDMLSRKSSTQTGRRRNIPLHIASPLERFRQHRSSKSTSPLPDQEFDKPSPKINRRSTSPQAIDTINADSSILPDSKTVHLEGRGIQYLLPVPDKAVSVEGKTLLPPVREIPTTLREKPLGRRYENTCVYCETKESEIALLRSNIEDLEWRADLAEIECKKYQSQVYAMRKKYENRITPFRDTFEQLVKLRKENNSLQKENRDNKATLESSVVALQKQMTDALTTALKQNSELKSKLKAAENQICLER